jgi:sulfur carrier protein ThiS
LKNQKETTPKKQRQERNMQYMQLTIEHGMQSSTVSRPEGTTVGNLLSDPNIRAVVGAGENVTPVVEGSVVDHNYVLQEGDTVTLQARADVKA